MEVRTMSKGWISIDRALQDHWLFDDDRYFRWWITVLMKVNHTAEPQKFLLGDKFYYIKRGQASFSLNTWCDILNNKHTDFKRKTIRRFFKILEKDNMITYEKIGNTTNGSTLITVTNYEDYQGDRDQSETKARPKEGIRYNNVNNEDNDSSSIKSSSTNVLNEDKKYSTVEAFDEFNKEVNAGVYKEDTAELKQLYKIEGEVLGRYIKQLYIEQKAKGKRYESGRDFFNHFQSSIKFKIKFQ